MAFEDLAHLARHGAVAREVGRQKNSVRAQAFGANRGHGGAHTKFARFVRGGAYDRAVSAPGNDHWLATQLRGVPLLHRRIERIHIDMNDLAPAHARTILVLNVRTGLHALRALFHSRGGSSKPRRSRYTRA